MLLVALIGLEPFILLLLIIFLVLHSCESGEMDTRSCLLSS